MLYLSVKALHIIAMVCWFAGLFYLPRLFVYHASATDAVSQERFKVMERKLYRGIMTPAMVVTLALGAVLIHLNPAFMQQGWMHAKLLIVGLLVIYHFICGQQRKRFAANSNNHSHVFYRWFNEVPVLFLLAAVFLVVLKPF